jgi:hypothetical protein
MTDRHLHIVDAETPNGGMIDKDENLAVGGCHFA